MKIWNFIFPERIFLALRGPIIEVEFRQKILEIASERDNDLLEYAIYL